MFWIVLILNILVVGVFAIIGVNDHTITILWFEPMGDLRRAGTPPIYLYKTLFSNGVVGFWFSWLATLLALISTAGIFPDFLSSGSVDLYLAKPIGRARLFFTKYLAGLLFVLLQVTVFTVLCFVVLGSRAGLWEVGLFWAIPLVVLFFSYLYAVCVLLGMWTRSTVAALLLTLLAWFGIWAVDAGERTISNIIDSPAMAAAVLDDQLDELNAQIARVETAPAPATTSAPGAGPELVVAPGQSLEQLTRRRDQLVEQRKNVQDFSGFEVARKIAFAIKTVVPKTRETLNLLDRVLFSDKDLKESVRPADVTTRNEMPRGFMRPGRRMQERQLMVLERERARPVWWVVGTSLLFEAALLALAAWHFCTRDF